MGWIKRNLFFVIGCVAALVLLGAGGYYIFKGYSNNSEAKSKLDELYNNLQQLTQAPVKPGDDKVDNIKTAQAQEQQMREWIAQAKSYFKPVPPIPQGEVTSKTFGAALNRTVYELRQEAKDHSVNLPATDYNFSFQVQSTKLTISSGLVPLAHQLGEVRAISEVLFAARVNDLLSIQRVPVSDDDVNGLSSDYTSESPITNDLAIITPYLVTFQTFTPELARVISGFATSTNAFIVKWVSVQPASGSATMETPGMPPQMGPDGRPMYNNPYNQNPYNNPYNRMPPPMPGQPQPVAQPMAGKGGLQTVLKEQLLRITLEVDIVKLLPKS